MKNHLVDINKCYNKLMNTDQLIRKAYSNLLEIEEYFLKFPDISKIDQKEISMYCKSLEKLIHNIKYKYKRIK